MDVFKLKKLPEKVQALKQNSKNSFVRQNMSCVLGFATKGTSEQT